MVSARAWLIPYKVLHEQGGFDFDRLAAFRLDVVKNIFQKNNLHRFYKTMAEYFFMLLIG